MRFSCLLLMPICLLPAALWAQKKPLAAKPAVAAKSASEDPNRPRTLAGWTVVGLKRISKEQFGRVLALTLGKPVTPPDFEAAQARVLASGFFTSLSYEWRYQGDNATVEFTAVEATPLYPIRFESLSIDDAVLKEKLKAALPIYQEQVPLSKDLFAQYAAAIDKILGPGHPKTIGNFAADTAKDQVILFRPNTPRLTVAEVSFTGNKALSTTELQLAMAVSAIGTVWSESRFRQVLDLSVRALYERRGYIRVQFPRLTATPVKDVVGVKVVVEIDEGPPYGYGMLTFRGSELNAEKVAKDLGMIERDPFDASKEQQITEKLLAEAKTSGHLDAAVVITRQIDDAKKRVSLVASVDPGEQWHFGRLTIHGLDIVTEPAIRKLWGIKPNGVFDATYPDYFLNQIKERGELDNLGKTRAAVSRDERHRMVDVELFFEGEKKPPKPERP